MTDPLDTVALDQLLDRARGGDSSAWDTLLRRAHQRLELLARRMLRGFPGVRRAEDTGDVLQGGVVRLLRALRSVSPKSTREFFGLAAEQLRRELLDLAHRHRRGTGPGIAVGADLSGAGGAIPEPAGSAGADGDLDQWAAFHAAVAGLPAEEREVFMLAFYHGWTQPQIAGLFGVDERTVRRRWQAAGLRLNDRLGGWLPDV